MRKLIGLTMICTLLGFSSNGEALESRDLEREVVGDYPTRTLDARHAQTTGSPPYADRELEEYEEERDLVGVSTNEYDHANQLMRDDSDKRDVIIIQPEDQTEYEMQREELDSIDDF